MPTTLSIEKINLNGSILTTNESGALTINGDPVEMDSSINNIQDRLFIKGYCPISFYSRMPVSGNFLSELFLNESFMATGWLITCATPGASDLSGRFYYRNDNSAIDTTTAATFSLPSGSISQKSSPFATQILGSKIIGLDITNAPYDIESLSINLLGYFAGAGKFDRIPIKATHYARGAATTGNSYAENYIDYDCTFTGLNIYSATTGAVTGRIYSKNKSGAYQSSQPFGLPSGQMYNESAISFPIPAGNRFGFDISGATGAQDMSITAIGYYN